jgi:hypothetical protein
MTPQQRAARERKQKIFVAVGGLILLAILAIQLPKLMGGGSGEAAAETTAETTTTTTASGEVLPPADGAVPIAVRLTDTDRRVAPAPGQLRSFGTFARKDPFVPGIKSPETDADESAGGGDGGGGNSEGANGGEKRPAETPSKGFSVGETASLAVTVVSVNGVRQMLEPGTAFPAADPVFVLVEERPSRKSVVIGVAGGQYASGDRTAQLRMGKPLVLVNTATGARYRLALVSVGNGSASAAQLPGGKAPAAGATP